MQQKGELPLQHSGVCIYLWPVLPTHPRTVEEAHIYELLEQWNQKAGLAVDNTHPLKGVERR